jgi:hypothetical protein
MKAALVVIGIPVFALLCGSVLLFAKGKNIWSFLQVVGAGCLVIVALTHICEALGLFAWMHWSSNPALAITSISGVLPWVSDCFPESICFIR